MIKYMQTLVPDFRKAKVLIAIYTLAHSSLHFNFYM